MADEALINGPHDGVEVARKQGFPAMTVDDEQVMIVEKRVKGAEAEILVADDGREFVATAFGPLTLVPKDEAGTFELGATTNVPAEEGSGHDNPLHGADATEVAEEDAERKGL